jgi:hypothetical protein
VNEAPTITAIADQTIDEDTDTGAISFTVGDAETTDPTTLTLTATSSDQTLVPDANLALTGPDATGAATVTVTPAPDQNGGPATITVTVDDGGLSADETFDVTVTPTNDAPVVATSAGLTLAPGTSAPITPAQLEATDVDGDTPLTYTLTSGPSEGRVELATNAGVAVTTFTQADIDNGDLVYVSTNPSATTDSFDFTVDDGAGAVGTFAGGPPLRRQGRARRGQPGRQARARRQACARRHARSRRRPGRT